MATNILTNMNLNQNEIQNAVIQNLAVAPSDPKDGQMYFDTVSKKVKTWNGTKWIDGGSDAPTRMVGTVGTDGTVAELPSTAVSVGDTYVVVSAGTYASQTAKVGDMFIANSTAPNWLYVPSGNDGDVYKFSADNPALTGSGNVCEWTVTHNLGNKYPVVQVYEAASGEMVLADIEAVSTTALKIKINAESVEEGTYKAVVMG